MEEIERLRRTLEMIHETAQKTGVPQWQLLDNITAAAASALKLPGSYIDDDTTQRVRNNKFNDKHLLWWVMKFVAEFGGDEDVRKDTLLNSNYWKEIKAPDWVLPAIKEKYEELT